MVRSLKIWHALACAALAVALAFAWQFLDVRYNYGRNWSGLLCVGERWPTPPGIPSRNLYRFPASEGYDGQFYYYIAHDLFAEGDVKQYVDNPPLRWRRILVPAAARLLSFGREEAILPSYIAIVLAFVFAGTFWLARFLELRGHSAAWSVAFLAVPAVAVSLDRLTVDAAMAALSMGFALWCLRTATPASVLAAAAGHDIRQPEATGGDGRAAANTDAQARASGGRSLALAALLVLAPLARETGLAIVAATALYQLIRRRFGAAALAVCCALPWVAWALFVRNRLWGDSTAWVFPVPFAGLILRTVHPLQFAVTGRFLLLAAVLDYLALAGIWLALFLAARFVWKKQFGMLELACVVFAAGVAFVSKTDVWGDAYAFGRTMSPLLLWLALLGIGQIRKAGLKGKKAAVGWVLLAPLALAVPRIALQILAVSLPVLSSIRRL